MQHIPSSNRTYTITRKTPRTPQQLDVGKYTLTFIRWANQDGDSHIYRFTNVATKQVVNVPFASTEIADIAINALV